MRAKPRPLAEPCVDIKAARQAVKCLAVLLRDHSPMSYHEASLALAYCWAHTESIEQAEERERA